MTISTRKLAQMALICCAMLAAVTLGGCSEDNPMAPGQGFEQNQNPEENQTPPGENQNTGGGNENPGGGNEQQNPPEEGNDPPEQNDPPAEPTELVLFETTITGPIESAGFGFTNVGIFQPENDNDVLVVVESNDPASNILLDVQRPSGLSRNLVQFQAGDANPATLEITNPQRRQGHAIRIAEGGGSFPFITYTIRVTQDAD